MPIFIVAKNNLNIFYKNQSSDTLLKNAHAHRSPVKKQTISLLYSMNNSSKMKKNNFSDLFFDSQTTKKFEKLFHSEIHKCLGKFKNLTKKKMKNSSIFHSTQLQMILI